jgi:hypothetical protein
MMLWPLMVEANVAPISEPMMAWDELVGRPLYQVMRFQTIAARTVHMNRL